MEILLVISVGIFYTAGIYMLLRKSMVKLLIGLTLLGNGTNLLIFLMGDLSKGRPPIISANSSVFTEAYADPVPQALILTAIVISFGIQAFAIILLKKVYAITGSDNLDTLNIDDQDI